MNQEIWKVKKSTEKIQGNSILRRSKEIQISKKNIIINPC